MSDYQQLKRLAEHHINLHGDAWHVEESKALESLPTFSSEWFVAAASPKAVLALIEENEQLSSRPLQGELNAAMDLISTYRRVNRELRSERYQLKAEVEALQERAEGLRKGLHAASRAMWTSEADMDLQAAAADRVLSGDYSEVTP